MPPEELRRRLRQEASLDADAELAAFTKETGSDDPDAFLAHLRASKKIDDALFCELVAGQQIAVARVVEIRPDKTLVLEPRKGRTLVLGAPAHAQPTVIASTGGAPASSPQQATLVAGGGAAPMPPPAPSTTRYAMLGCLGKGAMGEVHVARDEDLLRKVAYKRIVDDAYLVDDAGRIVVQWSRAGRPHDARAHENEGQASGDQPIPLEPFPAAAIAERAARERSGMTELPGGKLAVFERLASLGWSYIVVADEGRLLAGAPSS